MNILRLCSRLFSMLILFHNFSAEASQKTEGEDFQHTKLEVEATSMQPSTYAKIAQAKLNGQDGQDGESGGHGGHGGSSINGSGGNGGNAIRLLSKFH